MKYYRILKVKTTLAMKYYRMFKAKTTPAIKYYRMFKCEKNTKYSYKPIDQSSCKSDKNYASTVKLRHRL